MNLSERCNYFWSIFEDLQDTNSIIEKRIIISKIPEWLNEDFQYIIECLNGKHKFGYTYPEYLSEPEYFGDRRNENNTVKDVLQFLQEPRLNGDLSDANIKRYVNQTLWLWWFFEPIVNRTLKLGIGNSILPKDGLAPMLAKKYEGKIKYDPRGYVLTEKLDGNRCIASYEGDRWIFRSRNGKIMHVDFDMGDLPKEFVYDGEVMSRSQTIASIKVNTNLQFGSGLDATVYGNEFNLTSGMINKHGGAKDLVYNIFDIMLDDIPYIDRRMELNKMADSCQLSNDIRILPAITTSSLDTLESVASTLLHRICNMGGEGIMINLASASYNHKRTDQLLKFKRVQSIDMEVIDVQEGNGKYAGLIGAIWCHCKTDDSKEITVSVGSGLSDEQRMSWALRPSDIIGKIVEIQYFSLSQDGKTKGTENYSLRFPRLKSVREDKNSTSEY